MSVEIKKLQGPVHAEAVGSLFVHDRHHPGSVPIGAPRVMFTLVVREKGGISSLATVVSHAGSQLHENLLYFHCSRCQEHLHRPADPPSAL